VRNAAWRHPVLEEKKNESHGRAGTVFWAHREPVRAANGGSDVDSGQVLQPLRLTAVACRDRDGGPGAGCLRRYTDLDCNPMMKAFCREPILWRTHSI
jgi:hypothetical protein